MFKNLFYRSCALVSELEDTLQHLHRWHRTWSAPPRDRTLDMYALEDRVLFSIAPIMTAAALQAAAGAGTVTVQEPPVSAPPTADQTVVAVHHADAGQGTEDVSQTSEIQDKSLADNSITTLSSKTQDQKSASNTDTSGTDRHVNFALIDNSLNNVDQLLRSLDPNTEVYLYDHGKESPTDILTGVYDWAKENHAQIDSLSIMSHGGLGSFDLGNQWISLSTMGDSAEAWKQLGNVMESGGDINIFGCNVAKGTSGQDLIDNIGRLSGSEVFASIDNTGYGGNWVLEAASTGVIASAWNNPLDTQILSQYQGQLAVGILANNQDIGSPITHGSSSYDGNTGVYTISGAGTGTWNSPNQFQFAYSNLNGDGQISAHVTSDTNPSWNAKSGVMFRDSTAADAAYAEIYVTPGWKVKFEIRTNNSGGSTWVAEQSGVNPANVSLKLVRSGNSFSAFYSTDIGVNWTQLGSARTVNMRANALVGLMSCSENTGQLNISTFDSVNVWLSADIGAGVLPGGTSATGNTTTLKGGGGDIWYSADVFHYAYQSLNGDGSLVARVTGVENTNGWAKAGVMIRESTAPGSSYVLAAVRPDFGITMQYRTGTDVNALQYTFTPGAPPQWIELQRSGNVFSAYYSSDGIAWTQLGSVTIAMASNVDIGLSVSSNTTGTLCTATFDHLLLNQIPTLSGVEGTALSYTALSPATAISSSITSSDAHSTTLTGAKVRITGNYLNGQDILSFTNTANITGSWNATTGILTLSGVDTLANYDAALRSVSYENNEYFPNTLTRTVSYFVSDGSSVSNTATRDIFIHNLAGLQIKETGGSTNVTEGGAADTYTLQLYSQPTDDVTVTLTPDSHVNVASTSFLPDSFNLIFTHDNWDTPQTITVTAVDNLVVEGSHISTIAHSTSSTADPHYNIASAGDVIVHITDNDGITITPITPVTPSGGLTTTQAGGTAQFSVVLDAQPSANVTIGLSSSDVTLGTVSASSLTFTPSNWNEAQIVTVTGVDDYIAHTVDYTIIIAPAVSNDMRFNGINHPDFTVTNTAIHTAGINVTPTSGLTTTQNGDTAQFSVVLNSKPTSDVTITFSSSDTNAGTIATTSGNPIVFGDGWQSSDWVNIWGALPQQGDNGWYYGYFSSTSDKTFNLMQWANLALAGNGAEFWQLKNGMSINTVSWAVARYVANETGAFSVNGTLASFGWNGYSDSVTLHIMINGKEVYSNAVPPDTVDGNHHVTQAHSITYSKDVGLKAGDILDICIDPNGWGGDSYMFTNQIQKLGNTMIFTPSNWNVPQGIIVTGVNSGDAGNVEYQITGTATSLGIPIIGTVGNPVTTVTNNMPPYANDPYYHEDTNYNGFLIPTISLTNLAPNQSGVLINQSGDSTYVVKGRTTDTYTVRLTSQPTAPVTVTIHTDNQLSTSSTTLTFTATSDPSAEGYWNTPQTVTVSAVDDNIWQAPRTSTITHSITSTDDSYAGLSAASVLVYLTDRVSAGVTMTHTGNLITTEAGGMVPISVVLDNQPDSAVTLTFSSSDATEGIALTSGDVVVNYSDWRTGRSSEQGKNNWYYGYYPNGDKSNFQPMTLDERGSWMSPNWVAVLYGWTGGGYPGYVDWSVMRYVVQETGVFQVGGTLAKQTWDLGGDGVTLHILLNGQEIQSQAINGTETTGVPVSVITSLKPGDILDFAVDSKGGGSGNVTNNDSYSFAPYIQNLKDNITFTPASWNIPQTIFLRGVADSVADGNVPYTIHTTTSSADLHYNEVPVADFNLMNIDNNRPQLIAPLTQGVTSNAIFSAANGNAISVQNVDTSSNPLHVRLTAINGNMTLGNTAGLTFLFGDGVNNRILEFLGSATAVNSALEGMQFNTTASTGNIQLAVNIQNPPGSGDSPIAVAYIGIQLPSQQTTRIPVAKVTAGSDGSTPSATSISVKTPEALPSLTNPQTPDSEIHTNDLLVLARQIHTDSDDSVDIIAGNTILVGGAKKIDDYQGNVSMNDKYHMVVQNMFVPKLSHDALSMETSALVDQQLLWKDIKAMAASGDSLPLLSKVGVGTVIGIGAGLSAGYAMMAFRWGALITSSLVTFPVWQWVDPLPILESVTGKSNRQKLGGENGQDGNSPLDESLETLMT
jgi:hypothetical protein